MSTATFSSIAGLVGSIRRNAGGRIFAAARNAYLRECELRHARATRSALSRLDDRSLRDLGFERGALRSIEFEFSRRDATSTQPQE